MLASEGCYVASESTIYRILRREKLLAHRQRSKEPEKKRKVAHHKATGPGQVWSWDITYLKTNVKGMFLYLYLFMDVWSRKIVAWDVYREQSAENAREIVMNNCIEYPSCGLILHSDNGGPMKGSTFLATLHWLGIVPSFSRPSVSNDNAYSESLFKTLKYSQPYPCTFDDVTEAKQWVEKFVQWYNEEHLHSGIKFVTPSQRHSGEDILILQKRMETYKKAKEEHPERFAGKKLRDWEWVELVELNPSRIAS